MGKGGGDSCVSCPPVGPQTQVPWPSAVTGLALELGGSSIVPGQRQTTWAQGALWTWVVGVCEVHFRLLLSSQENKRRLLLTMRSREERSGVISPRGVFILGCPWAGPHCIFPDLLEVRRTQLPLSLLQLPRTQGSQTALH